MGLKDDGMGQVLLDLAARAVHGSSRLNLHPILLFANRLDDRHLAHESVPPSVPWD